MSDEVKNVQVSDQETRAWMESLSEADRLELKRRALERRAVELLQPDAGPTDKEIASMDDQAFARFKRSLGIG